MVESQYTRAKRILTENKDKLTALATQLLEKEVIFKEDLEKIFGKRAWEREEQAIRVVPPVVNGNGSAPNGMPPIAQQPETPDVAPAAPTSA